MLATARTDEAPILDPSTATLVDGTVLVVEDIALNRRLITKMLERLGASTEAVEDGQQAVDRIRGGSPFDLVLMDMQLPVLDGASAVRKLRADGIEVPIVALTADALSESREECFDAGCDGFLAKPIHRAQFDATVRSHLQARPVSTTSNA